MLTLTLLTLSYSDTWKCGFSMTVNIIKLETLAYAAITTSWKIIFQKYILYAHKNVLPHSETIGIFIIYVHTLATY